MAANDRSDYRIEILCPDLASELLLERGVAQERLGTLFEISLNLYSKDKQIDLAAVLGKPLAVHVKTATEERYFHGIVCHFAMVGLDDDHGHYQVVLRPKLWLLGESATCRVFESQSVADILKKTLQEHGVDIGSVASSPVRFEHCVQYRETDLYFASRLMERWGLYYFHKHQEKKHVLEVVDSDSTHDSVGEFAFSWDGAGSDEYQITDWRISTSLRSSNYRVAGTEYLTRTAIDAQSKTRFSVESAQSLKVNDFEAVNEYEKPYLDDLAKVRMQAIDAGVEEYTGSCRSPKIAVGGLFTLKGHPRDEQNRQYLVVAATYQFEGMPPGGEEMSEDPYLVAFTAIDSKTPFSPPVTTRKPVVQGPHLATVVEETDEFGRVKVKFHWGNPDADIESCWARVSQNWAGKEWGGVFMPHVDHEVIVEFLDGDPDQPIVTGRVYNQENMPPLSLPGDKQKSIIRDHGGNEMMMDGTGGSQAIRLFSPTHNTEMLLGHPDGVRITCDKDWISKYLGKRKEEITGDSSSTVLGKQDCKVAKDKNEEVGGYFNVKVVHDAKEVVLGAVHKTIIGLTSVFIGGVKKEHIVGAEMKRIDGLKCEKINGAVMKKGNNKEVKTYPEAMRQVKGLVFDKLDDWKQHIKGEMFLKVAKLQEEADEKKEKSKNVEQEFKTLKVTGDTHSHQPGKKFEILTDEVFVMASKVGFVGDVLDIGGVFEVRK